MARRSANLRSVPDPEEAAESATRRQALEEIAAEMDPRHVKCRGTNNHWWVDQDAQPDGDGYLIFTQACECGNVREVITTETFAVIDVRYKTPAENSVRGHGRYDSEARAVFRSIEYRRKLEHFDELRAKRQARAAKGAATRRRRKGAGS